MLHRAFGLAVIALFSLAATSAQAGLIGKSFSAAYSFPNDSTVYCCAPFGPPTFTVGAAAETTGLVEGVTQILVDFGDNDLRLTLTTVLSAPTWNNTLFNGPIFSLLGGGSIGVGPASVNPATTLAGFDLSRVLLDAGRIGINWAGLSYHSGDVVAIDFGQIPEPASIVVLAMAVAGLLAARRARS
ncbi:MAG: hypothetical protein JWM77_2509 [Rhodospirillales bacterium]|nr:hypothetical protein [Rhodospirillales bacterium]